MCWAQGSVSQVGVILDKSCKEAERALQGVLCTIREVCLYLTRNYLSVFSSKLNYLTLACILFSPWLTDMYLNSYMTAA